MKNLTSDCFQTQTTLTSPPMGLMSFGANVRTLEKAAMW